MENGKGKNGNGNRKRLIPVQIKLTKDEFDMLKAQAKEMGLSMASYIRTLIYEKK